MVLQLADKGVQATPERLVIIITIAISHVVASGWDQFVSNVLLQEGFLHQIMRDLGFMVPDLLNIYLPIQGYLFMLFLSSLWSKAPSTDAMLCILMSVWFNRLFWIF